MDVIVSSTAAVAFESTQKLNLLRLSDSATATVPTDGSRMIVTNRLDMARSATLDLFDKGYLSRNSANATDGYHNGDFDYNGEINGSDYFLIDNAFLAQNTHVPPAPLAAVAAPSAFSVRRIASTKQVLRRLGKKDAFGKLSRVHRHRLGRAD